MPVSFADTQKGKADRWIRYEARRGIEYSTKQIADTVGVSAQAVLNAIAEIRMNEFVIVEKRGGGRYTWWVFQNKHKDSRDE